MENKLLTSLLFRMNGQEDLAEKIAASIPDHLIENPDTTFADMSMGSGQYLAAVVRRCLIHHEREQILPRIYGWESSRLFTNKAILHNNLKGANLSVGVPKTNMKFDVIIGNPPYNNRGKIKGQKQTSGTSLWLQFLKKIPDMMVDGGWCSLILPAAVGNTNSQGWRSLKNMRIESLSSDADWWFNVGTKIAQITFTKNTPTDTHLINGDLVDRRLVPILPASGDKEAVSIFSKISQFDSIKWRRDFYPEFVQKSESKQVLAMSFLDRSKSYKLNSREGIMGRDNLKKVNICWVETDQPEELNRVLTSKLFNFFAAETMFSGQVSVGTMRAMSLPAGWQSLESDEDIYEAYGLTESEIEYVEGSQK